MEEQLIPVTKNYFARRRGNAHSVVIDIGKLSEKGTLFTDIHVYSRFEWTHDSDYTKEEWTPAQVTWPSIGAQNSEVTTEFAEALSWAAKQAAAIDHTHKGEE
jgi:hypothetical protein